MAIQLVSLYPVPFVVVGLAVLLLRPDDRNAWLLALVFAGFVAGAPVAALAHVSPLAAEVLSRLPDRVRGAVSGVHALLLLRVSRPLRPGHAGSLAQVAVAGGRRVGGPPGGGGRGERGEPRSARRASPARSVPVCPAALLAYSLGGFILGLVSLLWNTYRSPDADVRRKGRVVVWGTLPRAGAGPGPPGGVPGPAAARPRPWGSGSGPRR